MKVLMIGDVKGWAIGNLIASIEKNLKERFNITSIYIHPREVAMGLAKLQLILKDGVDIVNFHYWRTATQLMQMMPVLKDYPTILSHWNHESLEKENWSQFDWLTHPTRYGKKILDKMHPRVRCIPMGIDLDKYSFTKEYPPKEVAIGYVGRIAPWKNLAFVCECCKELGYKVIGSGYVDKAGYWQDKVEKYTKDGTLEFNGGMGRGEMAPAILKDNLYKRMTVFVMASEGEYESGPLPAQEAMARGIPVLATCKGTLKDRGKDRKNILFFEENNKEDFKTKLKELVENEELRNTLRKHGWETAKQFPEEKMAWMFGKLYYEVFQAAQKNK